jgi:hypothetical protein
MSMTYTPHNFIDRIFKDKTGKVVISQMPNIPLWGWIISSILSMVFKHGRPHAGFENVGRAALVTWAYLEIRSGVSLFRRILGAMVLIAVLYGYFSG